jgi:ferredoxin
MAAAGPSSDGGPPSGKAFEAGPRERRKMTENRVRVVTIAPDRCNDCQACRLVCPFGLIRM